LLHPSEFCDDNNTNSTDGCASCAITPGYSCTRTTLLTPDVCHTVCGNGYKTADEECDDNGIGDGDGCSGGCIIETYSNCILDANNLSICDVCGNNVTKSLVETCDDGTFDSDGCGLNCLGNATGWTCSVVG